MSAWTNPGLARYHRSWSIKEDDCFAVVFHGILRRPPIVYDIDHDLRHGEDHTYRHHNNHDLQASGIAASCYQCMCESCDWIFMISGGHSQWSIFRTKVSSTHHHAANGRHTPYPVDHVSFDEFHIACQQNEANHNTKTYAMLILRSLGSLQFTCSHVLCAGW